jgi:hypothetical protein
MDRPDKVGMGIETRVEERDRDTTPRESRVGVEAQWNGKQGELVLYSSSEERTARNGAEVFLHGIEFVKIQATLAETVGFGPMGVTLSEFPDDLLLPISPKLTEQERRILITHGTAADLHVIRYTEGNRNATGEADLNDCMVEYSPGLISFCAVLEDPPLSGGAMTLPSNQRSPLPQ